MMAILPALLALVTFVACGGQPPSPTGRVDVPPSSLPSASRPGATPTPAPSSADASTSSPRSSAGRWVVPIVTLRYHARRVTPCGGEDTCVHFAELAGPDETWRRSLAFNRRPVLLTDLSNAAVSLAPGNYTLIMERYANPGLIVDDQPPPETLDMSCEGAFAVESGQGPVDVRVTFGAKDCEVVIEEQDPPVVVVSATVIQWCMSIGGCSYRATVEGGAESWSSVLEPVEDEVRASLEGMPTSLAPGHYSLTLSIHGLSDAIVNGQQSALLMGECEITFAVEEHPQVFVFQGTIQRDQCGLAQL